MVEHLPYKEEVVGSSPIPPTTSLFLRYNFFFVLPSTYQKQATIVILFLIPVLLQFSCILLSLNCFLYICCFITLLMHAPFMTAYPYPHAFLILVLAYTLYPRQYLAKNAVNPRPIRAGSSHSVSLLRFFTFCHVFII